MKKAKTYDNFNGTTRDLGGDLQGLEETGLLGTQVGDLSGQDDIAGSDGAGLGGRSDLVLLELLANERQVLFGEHKADVLEDVRQELLQVRVLFQMTANGLLHHGVLAHENDGMAAQADTDLLHLRRADVIRTDDEALGVLIEVLLCVCC